MPHSLLARFLIIFALLFAQMGGIVHGISHTLAEQSQDQSLPHDRLCDLCAVYAQIGSAIGSSAIHFDLSASQDTPHYAFFSTHYSSPFTAYASRAPPYSA